MSTDKIRPEEPATSKRYLLVSSALYVGWLLLLVCFALIS